MSPTTPGPQSSTLPRASRGHQARLYPEPMLNDTHILDLTDEPLAFGARMLADIGADVVRIEDARGDQLRMREPAIAADAPRVERGWAHLLYNAGKRSVAVDVDDPATWEQVDALLPQFDVVLAPLEPTGAAGRLARSRTQRRVVDADPDRRRRLPARRQRADDRPDRHGRRRSRRAQRTPRGPARLAGRQPLAQAGLDRHGRGRDGADHAAPPRRRGRPDHGRHARGRHLHDACRPPAATGGPGTGPRPADTSRSAPASPSAPKTATGFPSRSIRRTGTDSSTGSTMCSASKRASCAARTGTTSSGENSTSLRSSPGSTDSARP